ncbi:MAG: DUF1476 domain-containing protein [Magnetospirillum sp.]|nr:DUF1476 domain-containing protein [Magnetospirillum sp.]
MTLFDEREKAFEAKYRLDQETAFKVTVRRDKLLGLWAAEKMGLTADEATAYAKSLIETEMSAGAHDVGHKVLEDLRARDVAIEEDDLRTRISTIHEIAQQQVVAETAGR